MATYQITAPDGSKYRLTGPDNASHDDLVNAVLAEHPMAGMTTEELENAPRASTSIGDIGRSFGMGVTGAAKSLTDVFGAGSGVSNYLGDITTNIGKGLTPERKDEMARREELVKRAQGKGLGSELYANLAGVMEAPLQSIAQASGSSIPSILAGLAALPEAAPAGIVLGVEVAARLLHIHPNTLRRWSKDGRIQAYRIAPRGDRRFKQEEITRFLAENKAEANKAQEAESREQAAATAVKKP